MALQHTDKAYEEELSQLRARATNTNGSQCVGIAACTNATVKPVTATVVSTVDCMVER